MPDLDDSGTRAEGRAPSRRSVLRGAAGAGAAGIAATAFGGIVTPASARTPARAEHAAPADAAATDAIVVHVRDAAAGEIDVFRGTSQVRLHDRDLAARIVRASR